MFSKRKKGREGKRREWKGSKGKAGQREGKGSKGKAKGREGKGREPLQGKSENLTRPFVDCMSSFPYFMGRIFAFKCE